jgi:glucokinase
VAEFVIGIDVGGTKIAAGLVDRDANILFRQSSRSHSNQAPEKIIETITQIVEESRAFSRTNQDVLRGVGVGFAGHINSKRGTVLTNSNLPGWDNHPLRSILQERTNLPVTVENDANCAAWGEFRYGAGRTSQHMCFVTFSTGFGMGIIIDGQLYRGACGTAGEIGHTVVDPNGPKCTCGKHGCLMCYACGMALDQMARDSLSKEGSSRLKEMCCDCPEHIPAELIAQAAREGDPLANKLLEIAGRYFGIGLSTIVQVINPDTIVIGGGLARIGPPLLNPCIRSLNDNIHPVLVNSARIVLSELWEDAGLLGAAELMWDSLS